MVNQRRKLLDYLKGKSKMIPIISGSHGMGKTFLMNWVEDQARHASMQVIYVSGHLFWKLQPLSALFSSIALFRENNANLFNSILESISEEQRETLLVHLNIKKTKKEKSYPPELGYYLPKLSKDKNRKIAHLANKLLGKT